MSSIRVRLLQWLVGPILLVNLAGAGLTYLLAWTPARIAFDQGLGDAAATLAARLRGGQPAEGPRADGPDATWFVVRERGMPLAGDADFPVLKLDAGAQAYDDRMRGEPVRVIAQPLRVDGRVLELGVARTLRRQHEVRAAIVRSLVLIEGLLTLALVGIAWLSVTNGLRPLSRMRSDLDSREGGDLTPVGGEDVPFELAPVVSAFNDLLGKVRDSAQAREDFLADMAHQLRTPLAGLQLQLEWLASRHGSDPGTADSIRLMRLATGRMIRQTNQLLALARANPDGAAAMRREPVDLAALVQESIQYFVDEAGKKGLDIGFELEPAPVVGDALRLRDLVDNLVDNALRYTPSGGSVTVRTRRAGDEAVFAVEDSGPGIPPAKRGAVFQRHVRLDDRTTGSGLGLAIVQDIARAHRARVLLDDGPGGRGSVFTVRFPAG